MPAPRAPSRDTLPYAHFSAQTASPSFVGRLCAPTEGCYLTSRFRWQRRRTEAHTGQSVERGQLTALVVFFGRLLGFSRSLSTASSFFSGGSGLMPLLTSFSAGGDPSERSLCACRLSCPRPRHPLHTHTGTSVTSCFFSLVAAAPTAPVCGQGPGDLTTRRKLAPRLKPKMEAPRETLLRFGCI